MLRLVGVPVDVSRRHLPGRTGSLEAAELVLLLVILALQGCERRADVESAGPGSAATPAASYEKAFFPMREAARSSPDLPFSDVTGLDVDSRGNIYVGDWNNPEVTVLAADGTLSRTIGRKGEGPGEFQNVKSLHVLAGDSLLVFDGSIHRVTVFAPYRDRPVQTTTLGTHLAVFPTSVAPVRNTPWVVADYKPSYTTDDRKSSEKHRNEVLWILDRAGRPVRDSVLTFPASEALVYRSLGRLSVRRHPFGRGGTWKLSGRNRLYYAWTGRPSVEVRSLQGPLLRTITASHDPVPVRRSQVDSVAGALSKRFRKPLEKSVPDTWPAVIDIVVDEGEQVWMGLKPAPGQLAEWAVFRSSGEYAGSVRLPANVTLEVVRGGRAYGIEVDRSDVPVVVVYDVDPRLRAPRPPS
jgi:hypothetical protein